MTRYVRRTGGTDPQFFGRKRRYYAVAAAGAGR